MTQIINSEHFEVAGKLMDLAKQFAEPSDINDALELCGYTENDVEEIADFSLCQSETGNKVSLLVSFKFFSEFEQEDSVGAVWFSYEGDKLVANF